MHPTLSAWLSARLLDRGGGHRQAVLARFGTLRDFDRLPPDERARLRDRQLLSFLAEACARVPHYQALGLQVVPGPEEGALVQLRKFPVLDRATLQRSLASMVHPDVKDLRDDATGGSTGTPMQFKVDGATQIAREASLFWSDHLAGWAPGEKIAMLWGSDRDVSASLRNWRLMLRWWIENRRWYNAFDLSDDKMQAVHEALQQFRPHLLVAYAGTLFQFARFLREKGLAPGYPIRAMVSSAECINPEMRQQIETVFPAKVFDRYGNREFGAIAAECEVHGGLHINEHDCVLEVDSEDPWRVPGRILVTYLANRAMPFIRYDTGDLCTLAGHGPCACGRTTPRISPVIGRASDTIRTRAGRLIHGEYFTHLMYGVEGVAAFQFVQESLDHYCLNVAGDAESIRKQADAWKRQIAQQVGEGARIEVQWVADIPVLPSGKRRFTLSKLPPGGTG